MSEPLMFEPSASALTLHVDAVKEECLALLGVFVPSAPTEPRAAPEAVGADQSTMAPRTAVESNTHEDQTQRTKP